MNLQKLYDQGAMTIHIGGGVICASCLFVAWVFGVAPLMSETQQSTSVMEQAEEAEFQARQVKNQLDQLGQDLVRVEDQLKEQPISLKPASQINPLLADLARWSELHELSITRTNAGRAVALEYYDYVPIEIAGEGGYADLLRFFKHLHNERGDLGLINRHTAPVLLAWLERHAVPYDSIQDTIV